MKVTAKLEDELIQEVMELSGAKNITEVPKIALKDYRSRKMIQNYSHSIAAKPLESTYGAQQLCDLNQK
jgi:hypothetical protein